jgi:hypothetical protein
LRRQEAICCGCAGVSTIGTIMPIAPGSSTGAIRW